jgi:hypothetical protein
MQPNAALIEYHLRRLDGDALASLVADLWAARGYETSRSGEFVLARHGDGAIDVWIPAAAGRATTAATDRDVDVVVALDGTRGDQGRAHVVDGADLAEMLRYGIDQGVGRELCERYLGARPTGLSPPLLSRTRERAKRALGSSPAVFGVVVLLAVAVVGGAAGVAFLNGSGAVQTNEASAPNITTPVPLGSGETGPARVARSPGGDERQFPSAADTLPPGVTREGIVDVETLAASHERAMANRSHTVWLDRYRPQNLDPNRTRIQRDIDMVTANGEYLITSTDIEVETDTRERLGAVYYDGTVPYGAVWDESNMRYGRVFTIDPRRELTPTPESVRETVVDRYLSVPNTSVTGRADRNETTVYRVTGDGQPDGAAFDHVGNYSVAALVDARGFVRDVTVEYTGTVRGETYRIRREVTYGRIGSTTVEAPAWYERREQTNATGGEA